MKPVRVNFQVASILNPDPDPEESDDAGQFARQTSTDALHRLRAIWTKIRPELVVPLGLLYLVWWDGKFWFRQRFGKWAEYSFICLGAIELVNAAIEDFTHLKDGVKSGFLIPALLFFCGLALQQHHRKLEQRIARSRIQLNAIRLILLKSANPTPLTSDMLHKLLKEALTTIEKVVEELNKHKPLVNATLLLRSDEQQDFKIFEQGIANHYASDLSIHGQQSAAGQVSKGSSRGALYIPWTKLGHGVLIQTEQRQKKIHATYRRTEQIANAMQRLPGNDPESLPSKNIHARKSLLCASVPLARRTGDDQNGSCHAVLCIDCNVRDCFGDLEFYTIEMFAGLITLVMQKSRSVWEQ